MTETITTRHPQKGVPGQEISKAKYDLIRATIVDVLVVQAPITLEALTEAVEGRMRTPFPGKVPWYTKVVLMDLVAKKEVQRVEGTKPQEFQLWPELKI